jgi:antitoxin VapB
MRTRTAKRVIDGGSQALVLPDEFRFNGDEVLVRKDERSGDVILSRKIDWSAWREYFDLRDAGGSTNAEFMPDRPLNVRFTERSLFRR